MPRTALLFDDSVIAFDETDYFGIYANLNALTIPDFKTIWRHSRTISMTLGRR